MSSLTSGWVCKSKTSIWSRKNASRSRFLRYRMSFPQWYRLCSCKCLLCSRSWGNPHRHLHPRYRWTKWNHSHRRSSRTHVRRRQRIHQNQIQPRKTPRSRKYRRWSRQCIHPIQQLHHRLLCLHPQSTPTHCSYTNERLVSMLKQSLQIHQLTKFSIPLTLDKPATSTSDPASQAGTPLNPAPINSNSVSPMTKSKPSQAKSKN